MTVHHETFTLDTRGDGEVIDVTDLAAAGRCHVDARATASDNATSDSAIANNAAGASDPANAAADPTGAEQSAQTRDPQRARSWSQLIQLRDSFTTRFDYDPRTL